MVHHQHLRQNVDDQKNENPIMKRYPPVQVADNVDEDDIKALQLELAKDKPRKDVVLPLFKKTFPERRQYVLLTQMSVADLTERYRGFLLPYAVSCQCALYISVYHYIILYIIYST